MPLQPSWRVRIVQCWVFPAAIAWKLGLIALLALPPPANDAFFFDGAVVNLLRHGSYVNPAIALSFPISGQEFFSAYPPGYQAVLLAWMKLSGPTVGASLWLHGVLFSLFAVVTLVVLWRLGTPAGAINMGGLFLFGLTFHDRPDGVAQVLGMLALLVWLRAGATPRDGGRWLAAALVILSVATTIQVGAMYGAVLWAHAWLARPGGRVPVGPLLGMALAPVVGGLAVAQWWPLAWQGFEENLMMTPALAGLRWPQFDELLKAGRTAPGLLVAGAAGLALLRRAPAGMQPAVAVWAALLVPALVAVAASLVVVAPTYVLVAAYPQVAVVALAAGFCRAAAPAPWQRWWRPVVLAAAALVAIRAVGLSTWGVAAALDVSRGEAEAIVRTTVQDLPDGSEALVSSAFLYAAADQARIRCRHSDWVGILGDRQRGFRPAALIVTRFEYHRRFEAELAALTATGRLRVAETTMVGTVTPPDASPRWQRIAQHVSWAPVIVRLEWLDP